MDFEHLDLDLDICVQLEEKDTIDMFIHMTKDDISLLLELTLKGYLLFIHYEIIGYNIYAVKPFNKMEGVFKISENNGLYFINDELSIKILNICDTNVVLSKENVKLIYELERERDYICKKFVDIKYIDREFISNRISFRYYTLINNIMLYEYRKTDEDYCAENIQIMENIIPIKIYRDIISIEQVNLYSTVSLNITTKNPIIISYTILYGYDKMLTIYCATEKEFLLTEDLNGVLSISYNSVNALINRINNTNVRNNTCAFLQSNIMYFTTLISMLTKTCLRFLSFEVVAYVSDFVDLVLLSDNINKYNTQFNHM